ncbi:thioredoxin domain-containing protein 6 isoform X2 [Latimeria chalumnae]|uniref:thioredoxin domain-containing protein 6 isoform X2 n=1 Tax=Latimeria chalumnae TaxID=7897 RepID=UPI00313C7B86
MVTIFYILQWYVTFSMAASSFSSNSSWKSIKPQFFSCCERTWCSSAEADGVDALSMFRGRCEPVFLFCSGGEVVSVVRGVDTPLLQKSILEKVEEEKKFIEEGNVRQKGQEIIFHDEPEQMEEEEEEEAETSYLEEEDVADSGIYTIAVIKPDAVLIGKVEEIKEKIMEAGFIIVAEDEKTLTEAEARDFYQHKASEDNFEDLVKYMSSGPCHVFILSEGREENITFPSWEEFVEPDSIEIIRPEMSSRPVDRTDESINAVDETDGVDQAIRQLAFLFPSLVTSGGATKERTVAIIRPDLLREKKDAILQSIQEAGFTIEMQKEMTFTDQQAREFYKENEGKDIFEILIQYMTSGPILALALSREDAIQHWRKLLGPENIEKAKEEAPYSLRAEFAIHNIPINQLHGSSPETAQKEIEFFFPIQHTLAVIKPDVFLEHKEDILSKVKEAGFTILQTKTIELSQDIAEEFYTEQKEKLFYDHLVNSMAEGSAMMMILRKENAIEDWRNLMGPSNPEVAKQIAPNSIRAQFGKNILQNAVHGSSNEKRAMIEIRYLFGENALNPCTDTKVPSTSDEKISDSEEEKATD